MEQQSTGAVPRSIPRNSDAPDSIGIVFGIAGQRIRHVSMTARALGPARRALVNQLAESAPGLAARLFPVCGWAQEVACQRAIEAATDAPFDPMREERRELALLAESALTQIWRAGIEWPILLGLAPHIDAVRAARSAAAALRDVPPTSRGRGQSTARQSEAARANERLGALLTNVVLPGAPPPEEGANALAAWAEDSPSVSANLVRAVRGQGPKNAAVDKRVPATPAWISERLGTDCTFGDGPSFDGAAAEIGPFADVDKAERSVFLRFGPVAARVLAMLWATQKTRAALLRSEPSAPEEIAVRSGGGGTGCGMAATARGPLFHRVRLAFGCVVDFTAVAPTEWIVHPQGALALALRCLPTENLTRRARITTAAFDPCAQVVVDVREAADA